MKRKADEISHDIEISPKKTPEDRLEFLRSKEIFADDDDIIRDRHFELMNDPSKAPTEELREHYQSCQERLDRLLSKTGDKTFHGPLPDDVQSFDQFCNQFAVWRDPNESYVFHRDHSQVLGSPGPNCKLIAELIKRLDIFRKWAIHCFVASFAKKAI